ncbi:MAG: sigma 54-interacting transcriptional regulator [Acidobacteria bacterium]|nr:sigma 54-interacting transcriptional regulator [Acidobacteriota bacterium]
MSKKGSGPSAEAELSLAAFSWDRHALAAVEHATLPHWGRVGPDPDLESASPLASRKWSHRDSLSILAQAAAHQAMLLAVGIAETELDPDQWAVHRKRGEDVRLVRRFAAPDSAAPAEGIAPSEWIEALADYLGIRDLHVFDHAWFRADEVYAQSVIQDAGLPEHDRRWLRRAGYGSILVSPDDLQLVYDSPGSVFIRHGHSKLPFERITRLDPTKRLLTAGGRGSSILEPGSALGPEWGRTSAGSDPHHLADRILDDHPPVVWLESSSALDPWSRSVLEALRSSNATIVISDDDRLSEEANARRLGPPMVRIMAPSVRSARLIEERLGSRDHEELTSFVTSPAYLSFLKTGLAPMLLGGRTHVTIAEPERSFLAAVAVAGDRVPLTIADEILDSVGAGVKAESLGSDAIPLVDGELIFEADLREGLVTSVPGDVRNSIAKLASRSFASRGDPLRASETLILNALYRDAATSLSERDGDLHPEDLDRALRSLPSVFAAPHAGLALRKARSLISQGLYDDALSILDETKPDHRHLCAVAHRRQGSYSKALDLVAALDDVDSLILKAEILRLTGELDDAAATLESLGKRKLDARRRSRLGFEEFLLALDRGTTPSHAWMALDTDRYHAERSLAYSLMSRREFTEAAQAAERALLHAPDLPCEIDAAVDRFYAGFLSGNWSAAREHGRSALSRIERAQGDRASAGVLFTLAFLLADDGRTSQAERIIDKLDRFYASHGDDRRQREIDLLRAQLALIRFDLKTSGDLAHALIRDGSLSGDLLVAAELVLHEARWACGGDSYEITAPATCEELERRRQFARARLRQVATRTDDFNGRVIELEEATLGGDEIELPVPSNRSEQRLLLRSALGLSHRGAGGDRIRSAITELSRALGVEIRLDADLSSEDALFTIAGLDLEDKDVRPICGRNWFLATRNRLARWMIVGTETRDDETLDEWIGTIPPDVVRISDSRLLWVDGGNELGEPTLDAWGRLISALADRDGYRRIVDAERAAASQPAPSVHDLIIGASPKLLQSLETIRMISPRDIPVLIGGESGTGKELAALAIHRGSPRRSRPFIEVNCAALPESLVESELFGHVRGAFTGADRDRVGLVEQADGGTLFLDELGEMPLSIQAKILRLLQEGQYRRVGDSTTRTVDVRIVAATNRDLASEVDSGRFREDLYYRVRGAEIQLPPLRERGDDIRNLAEHFLRKELREYPDGATRFSDEAAAALESWDWPGNVRELAQVVRASHALAGQTRSIELQHIPERIREAVSRRPKEGHYKDELERFRRDLIQKALLATGGSMARAADRLGITRQALSYQARELGIRTTRKRPQSG